jgi:DNA-binding NarL/FixJ family response regulator
MPMTRGRAPTPNLCRPGSEHRLGTPRNLVAHRFEVGNDAFTIFEFSLPCHKHATEHAKRHGLTSAELDVLRLTLAGLNNVEIARSRKTVMRTVANQVAAIFRKLSVHSRMDLHTWAAQVANNVDTR